MAGRPRLRCCYWGENRALVNLGDLLVPLVIAGLGYRCVPRRTADAQVVNPGRCLLVVGSLLTEADLGKIDCPVDVWGCGWKGRALAPRPGRELRFFAVRGPETAQGLNLPAEVALGDPALLLPRLLPPGAAPHGRTLVIPHGSRLDQLSARERCLRTGCDELLAPLVLRAPWDPVFGSLSWATAVQLLRRRWRKRQWQSGRRVWRQNDPPTRR